MWPYSKLIVLRNFNECRMSVGMKLKLPVARTENFSCWSWVCELKASQWGSLRDISELMIQQSAVDLGEERRKDKWDENYVLSFNENDSKRVKNKLALNIFLHCVSQNERWRKQSSDSVKRLIFWQTFLRFNALILRRTVAEKRKRSILPTKTYWWLRRG